MKWGPIAAAVALAAATARWRNKMEPTLIAGAIIVIAGLAVYGSGLIELPNAEDLIDDAGRVLGRWTYLVVALMAFLETGAFVGLIAPGETAMVFGGVVAGQGRIDLYTLIGIVWAAAVAGDVTSFYLGRRLGRAFLVKHGPKFQITEARLAHVEGFFERHGGKTILVGRFVGLVRAIAPFLAGSSGMTLRRFLPYDVIGAGLWATTFLVIGYLFWQSFSSVVDYAEKGALAFGSLIVFVVAVVVAVRWFRQEQNRIRARAWIDAQLDRPALRPLVRVLRPVWRFSSRPRRFLVARITPGELGLEVTTLAAVAAVGSFAFIAPILSLRDRTLTPVDIQARDLVADLRADWLIDLSKLVTHLGDFQVVAGVVLVAACYFALRRRFSEALTLPVALALTYIAVHVAKDAQDRPRPSGGLVETAGSSFPSGHSAYAVAWIGIALVIARTRGFINTTAAVIAGVVIAVAVGLSRVYLGVQFFSDVTAGVGLAAVIFAFCVTVALVFAHVRQNAGEQ